MKKIITSLITTALLSSLFACSTQGNQPIFVDLTVDEMENNLGELQIDEQNQDDELFWADVTIAPESDFEYDYNDDGEIVISDYTGNAVKLRIPDTIEGMPVTKIGTGRAAFCDCTGLTEITLPAGVVSIGVGAFFGCEGLREIKVSEDNQVYTSLDGVLFSKDLNTIVIYPRGKIGDYYTIPNSVTSIGEAAFAGCSELTSITIPDSVTSIGDWAFAECLVKEITIPDSVTSIGDSAFIGILNIKELTIYGVSGSYAEEYADNEGIDFVAVDI
ncbi:MAG: leucine-rich repeat protein [Oscillospiraceae bacterium]|nr:leucine-rich repeat protein [Oscillospiraceae bacterium]